MPETEEGYALTPGTHAHRLAKWMIHERLPDGSRQGCWVGQLRAAIELHINEIHPRLPEIERAGGVIKKQMFGSGDEQHAAYTLLRAPRVAGYTQAQVDGVRIRPADPNNEGWVPPPRLDRIAA